MGARGVADRCDAHNQPRLSRTTRRCPALRRERGTLKSLATGSFTPKVRLPSTTCQVPLRTISRCGHPDRMSDEVPYDLTPEQWSTLTDDERLLLMTADTSDPVPNWVTERARRILYRATSP